MDPAILLAGGALFLGAGLGAGALLVRRLARRETVPLEVLEETPAAAPSRPPAAIPPATKGQALHVHDFDDHPFVLTPAPARPAAAPPTPPLLVPAGHAPATTFDRLPQTRPVIRHAPEPPREPIQTEWARRQVGPVETGRMKGMCSGCGTSLSISMQRPIRIACPVCGRTRLMA